MINPLVANSRMIAAIGRHGVRRETDRIRGIEVGSAGIEAVGERGAYRAGEAVVAAAWGSGPIARSLGTPVPTVPEPLHMNITEACGEGIAHLVQHAEHPLTLKQLKTGQIVIGGGWPAEDRGPDRVPGVRASSLLGNVGLAARLVPAIRRLRLLRTWAGMNTTVDGVSVIGRLPGAPRVTMAIPGDAGFTLGPLVARMACALVLGRPPPEDPAQFSPARFGTAGAPGPGNRWLSGLSPRRAGGDRRPIRNVQPARKSEATT